MDDGTLTAKGVLTASKYMTMRLLMFKMQRKIKGKKAKKGESHKNPFFLRLSTSDFNYFKN